MNNYPRQLEIEFFWPLTEQIPLDLDFTECTKPKLATDTVIGTGGYTFSVYDNAGTVSITAANMNIDVDNTTIKVNEKPNICRRLLYKCLGLKWEVK